MNRDIAVVDHVIARALENEMKRQRNTLMMIPSENYASRAVLQATGSVLTNKYAEGYPHKRYYNGCEIADEVESLAIDRCKELFGCQWANMQVHTGSQANLAVFFALLNPGDTVLGMNINHGGHLTHGLAINFSGKYFDAHTYGVDEKTEMIDYEAVAAQARKIKPKMIIAGASAYSRNIDFERFRRIADETGAILMADIAHVAGLVAAKYHPDPVPYCHVITSTTHKTLRGPRGALIMGMEKYGSALDKAVFPGLQGGPLMHVIAAKAVAFKEAHSFGFREYQQQIINNAKILADVLKTEGFRIVSGGTDNHLMLVDVGQKGLGGRRAANLLEAVGIVVNKNVIPFDKRPPADPSGIRPGTPAITTRGIRENEIRIIGKVMADVLNNPEDPVLREKSAAKIQELCEEFPIYTGL